ncbi:MAG: fructose-bisphosphatase class II [candidate division Zixibacteria bacterium]|nr:fructose-bisphosphatase class II [candidate division Zixibacteria bacterium]
MDNNLRFNIADRRLSYNGQQDEQVFSPDQIIEFNHRHKSALHNYDIALDSCTLITLSDKVNFKSNLGTLRNRQVRQSAVLSAALSAIAVGVHGRGSINNYPKDKVDKDLTNFLKRANDRTSAQIMAEVLQNTTETLPIGEEVLIESAITEGVRVKPGKEAGGNPTIAVGAVFGKEQHRSQYGLAMPRDVALLSMGSDVVEGTTKSVKGLHSSMTALFISEANVKRHLPDIYVQRWMSGAYFKEFNPRELKLLDAAEIIANSYNMSQVDQLSSFFLDRPRHYPAMDILNEAGIATPFDKDGDLMPGLILGLDGVQFPDQRGLYSMIGEIGGSAEWVIGVLPLVWRGGQALGMLTSQSSLTRKNLSPEEKWRERFHFTEEEFMLIQDARFERKPYFTISDIIDDPFAGGISAFAAITDNYFIPFMKGVEVEPDSNRVSLSVLVVNSLGVIQCWQMVFKANNGLKQTIELLRSPKEELDDLRGKELENAIGRMLDDPHLRERYRIFFNNEYYPALIPVRDKMVLLHKAVDGLIERKALRPHNREIIEITERLAREWFINSD